MKSKGAKTKSTKKKTKKTTKSGSRGRKSASRSKLKENDIISLILRDHKPIKDLIIMLKNTDMDIAKRRPAYEEFSTTLLKHAKAEEQSLYVQLKKEEDLRIEGLEAQAEHAIAEQLIGEINRIKDDDDQWTANVKVLAEIVEHHVEEEESEMLKEVRKEMSAEEREQIGEEYSKLFDKQGKRRSGKLFSEQNDSRSQHA